MLCALSACSNQPERTENEEETESAASRAETEEKVQGTEEKERGAEPTESTRENQIKITVGDAVFTATLEENSSADALKELLQDGPLTIDMSDYGDMEKVGPIGKSLPTNDEDITTEAGDLILYQGNSLVIYYDTNSWNFTRLGKIDGITGKELLEVFGKGNVTVTFSL
ncbi:MAG: hypothetical protein K2J90_02220 [Lachnospiraceae bacterium]|nr:hypothetical protein [Lachnospiraceae bacterium]